MTKAKKLDTPVVSATDEHPPNEYPKMLTATVGGKVVPVMRHGVPVVFANKDEEAAYAGDGQPHSGAPEQHSAPDMSYHCYFRI